MGLRKINNCKVQFKKVPINISIVTLYVVNIFLSRNLRFLSCFLFNLLILYVLCETNLHGIICQTTIFSCFWLNLK